jgi:hypothetical protein
LLDGKEGSTDARPERLEEYQALTEATIEEKTPHLQAFPGMELAGLEPATSWVRSSRPLTSKELRLQRFMGESLECRNISRNSLHRVLQRHEILDRSAGATEKERGRAPPW